MDRKNGRFHFFLAALLSGILLWLSWPAAGFTGLIFLAFLPLFWLEEQFYRRHDGKRIYIKIFGWYYLCMLVWNVLTTWWVWNASEVGGVIAMGLNSFFMAIILLLSFATRRHFGSMWGYISLILYWTAFEFLHLNWDISWPWLNLGNVFATAPHLIQWYEYTGALGGTVWILAVNILFFLLLRSCIQRDLLPRLRKINTLLLALFGILLLTVPLLFSFHRYHSTSDKGEVIQVAVVQPNVDPYNEKFNGSGDLQLAKMLRLSSTVIDSNTRFLIGPETALPDGIWENDIQINKSILTLRTYLTAYPELYMITGLSSYKAYQPGEKPSLTARKFKDADAWYDAYNTAMMLNKDAKIQLYHKSRLVPGIEKMPYPRLFGFLEDYAIKLGGTSGSLGMQDTRTNFISAEGHLIAPAICYESVYGGFMASYIRSGAQFIAIITNDGWWGDTPGYQQHMQYARLRAVEFRRSIARSANTGISCIINQRGEIEHQTNWWQEDAFQHQIRLNTALTFYARHGDYIGFIAAFLSVTALVFMVLRWLLRN